jgi:uncharacterized membrane protein (DUF373 family)
VVTPRLPGTDDEGLPTEPPAGRLATYLVLLLHLGEDVVFFVLSVLLFGIAVVVLARTGHDLIFRPPHEEFAETMTRGLNGVLFVVIVMESLRTIIARFQGVGFRLQPFLVIAIISTVRHILTVGARLSLAGEDAPLQRTMIELGVNAGVVLALTVSLVLIRRYGGPAGADPGSRPGPNG